MTDQGNAKEVIDAYQRRQSRTPRVFVFSAIALVLIFVGAVLLISWYQNDGGLNLAFLATDTPTPTNTATSSPVPPTSLAPWTS